MFGSGSLPLERDFVDLDDDEALSPRDTVYYPFWLLRPIYDQDDIGYNTNRRSTMSYANVGCINRLKSEDLGLTLKLHWERLPIFMLNSQIKIKNNFLHKHQKLKVPVLNLLTLSLYSVQIPPGGTSFIIVNYSPAIFTNLSRVKHVVKFSIFQRDSREVIALVNIKEEFIANINTKTTRASGQKEKAFEGGETEKGNNVQDTGNDKRETTLSNMRGLTLRINRELAVAVAVREHARGVKLPQGSLAVLLGRASEDLVVVGVVQQAQHLGERQVDVDVLGTANYGSTVQTIYLKRVPTHNKFKDEQASSIEISNKIYIR
ncbi:hypothetical protein WN51_01602 [Melipona quadrifasciata]|uniref:Uncharacterized protein n=1 Tax=Melipona quadrifasciata TaxID=166423 RepID=A0A0M8ZX24_9HYME|nr:hypothetical protein WN51_01602 [Melipona quadrifasciata]